MAEGGRSVECACKHESTSRRGHARRSKPIHWLLIGVCLLIKFPLCVCDPAPRKISNETRLFNTLMKDLQTLARPIQDASQPVVVTLDPLVLKILDVDEKNHILTTNGYIYHEWNDYQLVWKPEDFGGLKKIRIPVDRIWTPDIVLFNNADESYKYVVNSLAIVYNDGRVLWVPHARLRSYCDLDLSRFPFDKQSCAVIFGCWTYDVSAVNLTQSNKSEVEIIENGKEWKVTLAKEKYYKWTYAKAKEEYAGIIVHLTIKRVSAFYQYIFIMPTVLLAFLALLTPFIPPLSQERITYSVALIIGCTLILMMLEDHMPNELGTVPVVAAYLAYIMVMMTVIMFFSILVVNMNCRDPKHGKVPGWIRWIFLTKLNKLVCLPSDAYTSIPLDLAVEEQSAQRELYDYRSNGTSEPQTAAADDGKTSLERTMEDIRRYLRVVSARAAMPEASASHSELVIQEWMQVARVIDRLMFMTFFVLTIVITISMYAHY